MITNDLILLFSEWLGVMAIILALRAFPSFQFKAVDFIYKQREGVVSLSLYAAMLLVSTVIVIGRDNFSLIPPQGVPQELWIRLIIGGIGLLAFGLSLLIRRQPLLSVGWNRKRLDLAVRLAVVLALLSVFLRGKAAVVIRGLTPVEATLLLVWLGIALAEETIFRGFIQMRLNAWMGARYGWLATALLYVIWNVPFAMMISPLALQPLLLRAFLVVAQSLVLGYLSQKTGHILPVFIYRAISEWLFFMV